MNNDVDDVNIDVDDMDDRIGFVDGTRICTTNEPCAHAMVKRNWATGKVGFKRVPTWLAPLALP